MQVCYPCPVVLSMVDLGAIRLVFVVGPQYCLFWALKILFESGQCSDLVSIDPQPTLLEAKWITKISFKLRLWHCDDNTDHQKCHIWLF